MSTTAHGVHAAPCVSVVVPARNEVAAIGRCLDSVLAQTGTTFEVVVVDNGSTDGTADLLRERAAGEPRLVVLHHPEPSIPGALNRAVASARGRWIVRVDAHSTISEGYLALAVDRLEEGRWSAVGGRKVAVGSSPSGMAVAAVLNSRLAVGGSTYHWGTTAQVVDHVPFGCYSAERVRALGGWDEALTDNEDFEFDQRLRASGPLLFEPRLQIDWDARESVRALYRQYRRYGRGKPVVALRHPGSVRLRHLAPPALVAYLAAAALVGVRRPGLAAAAVAPYAAGLAVVGRRIARDAPEGTDLRQVPLALGAMQVGWGVGFWQGAARLLRERLSGRGPAAR